jgi:WS/DGAT/MGAT family acyltransferase
MMRAWVDRLGAGDVATLWAEEPATPFHIGLAGLLDPGPLVDERGRLRLQELRAAVEGRLARVPELRRRIRWTGFGQGRPAVVDDHDFDIGRHLTDVDLTGVDEPGFWSWCANQMLEPLDRDHPLWRVTLAIGLASGQVGVLVVMHHALADRIAGATLAQRLLDPAPDTTVTAHPWQPTPPPGPLALAVDAVVSRLAAVAMALRHLPSAPRAVGAAGRDAAATRAALANSAPVTSLDHPIGPGRQLAVIRRPLAQVRQAGHAHGATVNDVLLAAVAGGLHDLVVGRGEPVEGLELRVSVPVGAPGRARNAGGSTPVLLPLPVGHLDPAPASPASPPSPGPPRPAGTATTGGCWPRRCCRPACSGWASAGCDAMAAPRSTSMSPTSPARLDPVARRCPPADRGTDRAPGRRRPSGRGGAVVCRRTGHLQSRSTTPWRIWTSWRPGWPDHLDQLTASGRLPVIPGRRG